MVFRLHYGLWYGALVGIIPFMFNYASKYSGATATQQGTLYTVLPFIALIAKPIVCSIADRYSAHRLCLLLFIILTMIGFGSLAIYPFFGDWSKEHQDIVWILYCLAALVGNTSMCVVNSIGDSLAINSCQRKEINYGQYRLWGPVGFGIFGAVWGLSNEILSLPRFTPGIITLVVILLIDIIIISFWKDKSEFQILNAPPLEPSISAPTGQETTTTTTTANLTENSNDYDNGNQASKKSDNIQRLALLGRLMRRDKSVIIYIFIFTFCGIMTGLHWQFYFGYLQKIAEDRNQNFELITTLALPVQSLGGELIFFMLFGKIIKSLGASLTLVLCLFSFAARYLLYAYLIPHVNIYWVLLVELFQGPAFGLMYCVLTHQANAYSEKIDRFVLQSSSADDIRLKKSLHATLQGILGASFEGLGVGLGAIIGGSAYDFDPILMWQIAGFSASAVASLYLIGTLVTISIGLKNNSANNLDIENEIETS